VAESYGRPAVSVYFGESGKTVPDPFLGGAGPDRTGCVRCGIAAKAVRSAAALAEHAMAAVPDAETAARVTSG
jgi:hypothetical protein